LRAFSLLLGIKDKDARMAAVAKNKPHWPKGWCARAVVALLLCLGLPGAVSASDYVFPTQPGPFNLQPGDTLTVASGNYTGSLNNIPSNATVFVNAGATLTQGNLNISGSLVVRSNGTATLGGANLGTGWSMFVEGALTLSGSMNMNGAGQLSVRPTGSLLAQQNINLQNNSTLLNAGLITFQRELATSSGTTAINSGRIIGTSTSGSFNPNGIFTNTGLMDITGFINFNSQSQAINWCSLIARNGFNNNSPNTQNYGVIVTVAASSSLQINQPLQNGAAGYLQAGGTTSGFNFTNNASAPGFWGGGNLFIAGRSLNQGVFGSAALPVNVFDATPSPVPGRLFDVQNTAPHPSTTNFPITPLTVSQASSQCAYSPVVAPPQASDDTASVVLPLSTPVVFTPLANDTAGGLPIDPPRTRLLDAFNVPQTSVAVPGQGTWTVNTTTGAVTFIPSSPLSSLPSPIRYTAADTQGNRSNPAVLSFSQTQANPLVATKTVAVLSSDAQAACTTLTSPDGSPSVFIPGACVLYTIAVSNPGSLPATQVNLSDSVANVFTFLAADHTGFGAALLSAPAAQTPCSLSCVVSITQGVIPPSGQGQLRIWVRLNG
jgi:uncharacterized repeat protein (TIGR01451 family)